MDRVGQGFAAFVYGIAVVAVDVLVLSTARSVGQGAAGAVLIAFIGLSLISFGGLGTCVAMRSRGKI